MISDNDIKKALECCSSENGKDDCLTCPNFKDFADCKEDLSAIALDLINRKDAEIEKLNVELVGMRGACESYKMHYDKAQTEIERLDKRIAGQKHALFEQQSYTAELKNELKTAKSEAIKEFWKRFDKVLCENIGPSKRVYWEISSDGNNLVKEMTESVNYGSSKMEVSDAKI